jgi:hypothetical protein
VQIGRKLVFDAGDEVAGKPVPALHQEPEKPAPSRTPAIERGLARSGEPERILVRSD